MKKKWLAPGGLKKTTLVPGLVPGFWGPDEGHMFIFQGFISFLEIQVLVWFPLWFPDLVPGLVPGLWGPDEGEIFIFQGFISFLQIQVPEWFPDWFPLRFFFCKPQRCPPCFFLISRFFLIARWLWISWFLWSRCFFLSVLIWETRQQVFLMISEVSHRLNVRTRDLFASYTYQVRV